MTQKEFNSHLWVQNDADLDRFVKLGVIANFTPAWHSGNIGGKKVNGKEKV